jgi:hypothetical protein
LSTKRTKRSIVRNGVVTIFTNHFSSPRSFKIYILFFLYLSFLIMNYNELKSGTDIRGVATGLGGNAVNLTNKAVADITAAFVLWLSKKYAKDIKDLKIAVGRDSRITGGAETSVFLVDNFYAGVLLCQAVAYFSAFVRRAIVNQNDLNIFIGLGKDGANASFQIFFHLINGDNYGNKIIIPHKT